MLPIPYSKCMMILELCVTATEKRLPKKMPADMGQKERVGVRVNTV